MKLKSRHRYTEFLYKKWSKHFEGAEDAHTRWKLSKITPWNPFRGSNAKTQHHTISSNYYNDRMIYEYDLFFHKQKERISYLRNRYNVRHEHVPTALLRKGTAVGFEIECIIPFSGAKKYATKEFNPLEENLHRFMNDTIVKEAEKRKIKHLTVSGDGSIREFDENKASSFEFKLLMDSSDKDRTSLKALCQLLKDVDTYVNKSCGLHVHLDQRHNDSAQALTVGTRLNNALFGLKFLVPKNRRNNSYCQLVSSYPNSFREYIETLKESNPKDYLKYKKRNDAHTRYAAINLESYDNRRTIEIRLHSGTASYVKMSSWLDILLNICNNKNFDLETFYGKELKELEPNDTLMKLFVNMLDLPSEQEELKTFIWSRYNKLKKVDTENEYLKTSVLRKLVGNERSTALYGNPDPPEQEVITTSFSRLSSYFMVPSSAYAYSIGDVWTTVPEPVVAEEAPVGELSVEAIQAAAEHVQEMIETRSGWRIFTPTATSDPMASLGSLYPAVSEAASRDDPIELPF